MKQLPQPLSGYTDPTPQPHQGRRSFRPSPPRLPLKQLAYLTAGLTTLLLIVWAFRPAPIGVDTGLVQRGDLQVTVNAEGKTRVRDRFVIAAGIDGHLARIVLNEGDSVTAGRVVAEIDPLPLNASVQAAIGQLTAWQAERAGVATQRPKTETIQQSRTRIQMAEAQHQQAQAKVMQAQAALDQAHRDRERADQLAATGAIARQDREVAELNEITKSRELETVRLAAKASAAEVEVAKAALAVVQQEQTDPDYLLKVYDARIASTQAELSKLRDEAARTEIRSPVTGKVLRIQQKSAQFVTSGTAIMEVGNPAKLELVIDVLSSDAVNIKPGQPILIDQRADQGFNPPPIQATVRLVEPAAFTKISALGVEEQRVNVIGNFAGSPRSWGDAYRVDTKIVIWSGNDVLKTPISSLFRCGQSAWCAFVVDQGKAQRRPVTIGHRNDREAEVHQGLQPGETVILHPTEQIKDGSQVTPR